MGWLINRIWLFLFHRKKNKLIFLYQKTIEYSYSTKTVSIYSTYQKIINRILKGKETTLFVLSKFNNVHYPVIDVDDCLHLSKITKYLNYIHVGFEIIQSSTDHYWVIIDKGNKKFDKTKTILYQLQQFGDPKYRNLSFSDKRYCLRGYYQYKNEKPTAINPITINFDVTRAHHRQTGAWRPSFDNRITRIIESDPLSNNFNDFINKLKDYYNNECNHISELKYGVN